MGGGLELLSVLSWFVIHKPPIIKRPPKMQRVNGYLPEVVAYESQTAEARLVKMRSLDTSSFERECTVYNI